MTFLRDEFAKAALYGMLAHPTRYKPRHTETHLHWHNAIASEAYDIADAMVSASQKGEPEGPHILPGHRETMSDLSALIIRNPVQR